MPHGAMTNIQSSLLDADGFEMLECHDQSRFRSEKNHENLSRLLVFSSSRLLDSDRCSRHHRGQFHGLSRQGVTRCEAMDRI